MGAELDGIHDAGGGGEKVPSEQKYMVMEVFVSSRAFLYTDLSVVTSNRWRSACRMVCVKEFVFIIHMHMCTCNKFF